MQGFIGLLVPPLDELGNLRNVRSLIPNAFHVGDHFQGGGDGPQIPGHRLLLQKQLQAQMLNGPLHFINFAVVCYGGLCHVPVALGGRIHCCSDRSLAQAPHGNEIRVQLFQLLVKAIAHHPNLPVM